MMDTESSEARTLVAEGLCKLLLARRITSSKLMSRLILMWYNPVTGKQLFKSQLFACSKQMHCI